MLQIALLGDQRFTLDGVPLAGSLARRSVEIVASLGAAPRAAATEVAAGRHAVA